MAGIPGKLTTVSLPDRPIHVDGGAHAAGWRKGVTLDSATVDSGSSPTTILRPGLVVGKTANGDYIDSGDATVVVGTPATHTGGTSPSFAGAEDFTYQVGGGATKTITTPTAATAIAGVVTALNGDEEFNSSLVAENDGGLLKISSIKPGADQVFEIVSAPAGWNLTTGTYVGAFGEFGVVEEYVDMLDALGTASDQMNVTIVQRGRFKNSNLIGLTDDARRFFQSRGSTFE